MNLTQDMGVAGSLLALGHRCRGLRLWLFGEEAGELSGEQLLNNLPAVQCIPILKSLTLLSKHIGARAPPEALEGASSIAGPFPFSITLPQSVTEQVLEMHLNELGHKVRDTSTARSQCCTYTAEKCKKHCKKAFPSPALRLALLRFGAQYRFARSAV